MARPAKGPADPNFVQRLEELSGRAGSMTALAQAAGLSPGSLQNYLEGGEPTRPTLIALAEAGAVSVEWLATGNGPNRPNAWELPSPGYRFVRFIDVRRDESVFALFDDLQSAPDKKIVVKEGWLLRAGIALDQDGNLIEREVFAIEAFDESLKSDIEPGDILFVKNLRRNARALELLFSGTAGPESLIYLLSNGTKLQVCYISTEFIRKGILVAWNLNSRTKLKFGATDSAIKVIGPVVWHGKFRFIKPRPEAPS